MKKIHRFLIEIIPKGTTITIDNERLVHQITSVLRIEPGETIALFTHGSDDYHYEYRASTKQSITLVYQTTKQATHPPRDITAVIAIPKSDTFELITQKLTELGVGTIVPIRSDRTIKQSVRMDRLRTISNEALEQCGGSDIVTIVEPLSFDAAVDQYATNAIYFDTTTTAGSITLEPAMVFYIGPEGGWSDRERTMFQSKGIVAQTLGDRILRAETAAIVASSKLLI